MTNRLQTASAPLFSIKQLEKDKNEEQQGVITIAGVYAPFSGLKEINPAIVVKQQQKNQYEPEQCAIISSAAALGIRHIDTPLNQFYSH